MRVIEWQKLTRRVRTEQDHRRRRPLLARLHAGRDFDELQDRYVPPRVTLLLSTLNLPSGCHVGEANNVSVGRTHPDVGAPVGAGAAAARGEEGRVISPAFPGLLCHPSWELVGAVPGWYGRDGTGCCGGTDSGGMDEVGGWRKA